MIIKYKIRVYVTSGRNVGSLSHEEFFSSRSSVVCRYRELFRYDLFSLNPTLWYFDKNLGVWCRLHEQMI